MENDPAYPRSYSDPYAASKARHIQHSSPRMRIHCKRRDGSWFTVQEATWEEANKIAKALGLLEICTDEGLVTIP